MLYMKNTGIESADRGNQKFVNRTITMQFVCERSRRRGIVWVERTVCEMKEWQSDKIILLPPHVTIHKLNCMLSKG